MTLFVLVTVMMAGSQFAFAVTSPGTSSTPDPIPPGFSTVLSIEESDEAPHGSSEGIYVFTPSTTTFILDSSPFTCPMPAASAGDYYILLIDGGTSLADAVNFWIPDTVANNARVEVSYGGGVDVIITPLNGAKVGTGVPVASGSGFGQLTPLTAEWHRLSNVLVQGTQTVVALSANSDQTTATGAYTGVTCGPEEVTFGNNYQVPINFNVIEPVGGEIISINTTALLMAGLTTSGMWMIPTLGVIAGSVITIYKIRKSN